MILAFSVVFSKVSIYYSPIAKLKDINHPYGKYRAPTNWASSPNSSTKPLSINITSSRPSYTAIVDDISIFPEPPSANHQPRHQIAFAGSELGNDHFILRTDEVDVERTVA